MKESRLLVSRTASSYAKGLVHDMYTSDADSDTQKGMEEMLQDLESVSAKNNTNDIMMM